jgi:hypothetical protein
MSLFKYKTIDLLTAPFPSRARRPSSTSPNPERYQHEYPLRGVSTEELATAAAISNSVHQASPKYLRTAMFLTTNSCHDVPSYVVPTGKWIDFAHHLPWMRFKDSITLRASHGPYVAATLTDLHLESMECQPNEFWEFCVTWFKHADTDIRSAVMSSAHGRRFIMSRAKATLWTIHDSEVSRPEFLGSVSDIRRHWEALQRGEQGAPVHCIRMGDERRDGLNAAGIKALHLVRPIPDIGILSQMCDKFDSHADPPTYSIFAQNSKSYYDHADALTAKVDAEIAAGVLQGPYPACAFWPHRNLGQGSAAQNGKFRRTGNGAGPHDDWDGLPMALNDYIPMDDLALFPQLQLPGVTTYGHNISIVDTLHHDTKDPRHETQLLLTDYEAFYRNLVPRILFMWMTTLIIAHSANSLSLFADAGTYFGDRGAATTANRVMNATLFWWFALFLLVLEPCTTYDVTTRATAVNPCLLLSSRRSTEARAAAAALISCMPESPPAAHAWDQSPAVRKWRQDRFDAARQRGRSEQDAISESIPARLQGFFDDGQTVTIRCLFDVLVQSMILMVAHIGLALSWKKIIRARPGSIATVSVPEAPTSFRDFTYHWKRDQALVLGRKMDLERKAVRDPPQRIRDARQQLHALERSAASSPNRIVRRSALQSMLGVAMWIVMILQLIRQKMNRPFACLAASLRTRPDRAVLTAAASVDLSQLLDYAASDSRPEQAFYPTTADELATHPVVFVMNDSAGAVVDNGEIVEEDTSFRGGACWLYAPGKEQAHTQWSVFEWPRQILHGHYSTALETANANASLEYAVVHFPGHIIVEVLDSQSSVHILRRLACSAPGLRPLLEHRSDILHLLDAQQRVLTVWTCREDGTLADQVSKHELTDFAAALHDRGLPPPAERPFARRQPRM